MERIDGNEIFFQKSHGVAVKTIRPFSIGLGVLPSFPSLGCGLVSQKLVQVVRPKRRDAVPIFLSHVVKRESRSNEISFQQHLNSVRCEMKDRRE